MRTYPALRITFFDSPTQGQLDRLVAELDDYGPTAIDDVENGLVAFFGTAAARDEALGHFGGLELVDVTAEDVRDENWAERSQAALAPVTVGRLTIAPPWAVTDALRAHAPGPVIVIQPSMGFGTGHHASTRLCLQLLQQLDVAGASVLDIGTGSGVLAICARRLGASRVVGIDVDPDALANARENLALNGVAGAVTLLDWDLSASDAPVPGAPFGVILANLTGALLMRTATALTTLAAPDGKLIVSGYQAHEADEVAKAFLEAGWIGAAAAEETEWTGALFGRA